MSRRSSREVAIDLDSEDECKSKRSRTSRRPAVKMSRSSKDVLKMSRSSKDVLKMSRSSKDVLPSFYDAVPPERSQRSSKRIASSRRDKTNKDKLDTDIFELYLEDLWKRIDEDKKSAYTYFDSLWFNMYNSGQNKSNVLKWIKAKKIFSRQYVFVPIVCWGHWNLLVLCNFGEANPRILLLDSLKTTNPTRLRSAIKRFIVDILKNEEREEIEQFKNEIHLEFPKVPQQNGDECGIFVLYFIHCFLQNRHLGEDLSQLDAMFDPEELENFRKDIHSFQANRNMKIAE